MKGTGKKKKLSDTKEEIRRMDRELLEAKLEMRKQIFSRIKAMYIKDLALLDEAQAEMNIFNEDETKEVSE